MGLFDLFKNKKADKLFDEGLSYWNQQKDKEALAKFKEAADSGHSEAMRYVGYCYRSGRGGVDIDYKKTVEWYEKSADSGKPVNRYNAAFIYIDGLLPDNNNENAIRLLEKALSLGYKDAESYLKKLKADMAKKAEEEAGEAAIWRTTEKELEIIRQIDPNRSYDKNAKPVGAEARYTIGRIYYEGELLPKNPTKALYWFEQVARTGEKSRQYLCGNFYTHGETGRINYEKGAYWLEKAAEQGYKDSRKARALAYYMAEKNHTNRCKAAYWFGQSARYDDDRDSMFSYAVCLEYGDGVSKNVKDAVFWYEKALEKGLSAAGVPLGMIYGKGEYVLKDLYKAAGYFEKAAQLGDPDGRLNIAISYLNGYGVPKDLRLALHWATKAAENGQEKAKGLKELLEAELGEKSAPQQSTNSAKDILDKAMDCLRRGDYKEAVDLLKCAATDHGIMVAAALLADFYYNGYIVENDMAEAFKWYSMARDSDEKSRFMLGEMYANGYGTPKDLQKALEWYEKSAKKGSKAGRYKRGSIHHDKENDEEALEYLLVAANKGSTIARLKCGIIYRQGSIWETDLEKAEHWLRRAAASDNPKISLEAMLYLDEYFD